MSTNYKWTVPDDIVCYYYYYYKGTGLNHTTPASISTSLGMSERSFNARIQNVAYVITSGATGLSHASTQTVDIVNLLDYSKTSDPNFQQTLQRIINRYL